MHKKIDNRNILVRFWQYQAERSPLIGIVAMAALTVSVFANFTSLSLRNYLLSVVIVTLYLIQTRMSDEKKDFEHDTKFHKDRPVQRGVVSLRELLLVNRIAMVSQLVIYVSFFDLKIFTFGLFSQGYAFLAKKEFFIRSWIRQHFFTYYFLHYIQWIILNLAILIIIKPVGVPYWQLISFVILNITIIDIARKMFAIEDDTTDDTFSARLGHTGSATVLSINGLLITLGAFYLINGHAKNYLWIILPVLAMGYIFNSTYHYAIEPNRTNANYVKYAGITMLLAGTLGVILGA